ncbi:hypothetical protein, partial [Plasmodium yoelii yoelii]
MNLKNIYICFNIEHKQRHKTQILHKYKKLRKLLLLEFLNIFKLSYMFHFLCKSNNLY